MEYQYIYRTYTYFNSLHSSTDKTSVCIRTLWVIEDSSFIPVSLVALNGFTFLIPSLTMDEFTPMEGTTCQRRSIQSAGVFMVGLWFKLLLCLPIYIQYSKSNHLTNIVDQKILRWAAKFPWYTWRPHSCRNEPVRGGNLACPTDSLQNTSEGIVMSGVRLEMECGTDASVCFNRKERGEVS